MLKTAPTLAIGGVDTDGNRPSKICQVTNQSSTQHRLAACSCLFVVFGCMNRLFGLEIFIRFLAGLKELSKFPLSSVDTAGGGGTGCPKIF